VITFHARHLPHRYAIGHPMFLTWRLHDSLPSGRTFPSSTTSGEAFLVMDRLLDNARSGPLHLGRPETAELVLEAIHYRDRISKDYDLHSFVVMANHVHLLITPRVDVSKMMQSLKRFTARECNKILDLTGQPFWQDKRYDRLVRDQTEFERIGRYIEMNPVTAGLVATPEEFLWSSARPIANRPQVANLPYVPMG
jgi:putative transposase